jgi:hypothetical protein
VLRDRTAVAARTKQFPRPYPPSDLITVADCPDNQCGENLMHNRWQLADKIGNPTRLVETERRACMPGTRQGECMQVCE